MDWELLSDIFKAMSDKTRLHILSLLRTGELCVCELVEILQMTQPSISQHLRKLKHVKLVKERKVGQWVFYSLDASQYPFLEENFCQLPDLSHEVEILKEKGLKICLTKEEE